MRSAIVVALVALSACEVPPTAGTTAVPGVITDRGETVLTINGTPVGRKELDLLFTRMRVPDDQLAGFLNTARGRQVAEDYAVTTALYEQSIQDKVYEKPDVQLELAFQDRQVLAQRMRTDLAAKAVTDEAVQRWYEENKVRFDKPQVRVRQIVVKTEEEAKEIMGRLEKGEDFATLAKEKSNDTRTASKGGEMPWMREHENPQIGKAAFAAELDKVTGPVQSRMGFHVFEVLEKRDSTPLEEVRPVAEKQLAQTETAKLMESMKKEAKIEWAPGMEPPPAPDPAALPPGHPPLGAQGGPPGAPGAPGAPPAMTTDGHDHPPARPVAAPPGAPAPAAAPPPLPAPTTP
jgi:peptidyl-prolyl cis-trans isomerase C